MEPVLARVAGSPRSTSYRTRSTTSSADRSTASRSHTSRYCSSCDRNSEGRIKRSSSARSDFKRSHPCPSPGRSSGACPGYVIDHIQALKHGGSDTPDNMQWQSKEEAKAKDRVE